MATFQFLSSYYAGTMSQIELPIKDWDEVDEWYVKWDTLHYSLKSDPNNWQEVELGSDTMNIIDWKRPMSVEVNPLMRTEKSSRSSTTTRTRNSSPWTAKPKPQPKGN